MENVEEWLDPVLNPVLLKDTYKRGFHLMLKMGENEIIYN
jgi:hypothetical protein